MEECEVYHRYKDAVLELLHAADNGNPLRGSFYGHTAKIIEYSGLRDTGVRGFGNRHSGSQKTMIPGMETIHTMP